MTNQNSSNPYQPPQANVEPTTAPIGSKLIAGGRTVAMANATSWLGDGGRLFNRSPGIWILNTLMLMLLAIMPSIVPLFGSLLACLLMPGLLGGLMLGCRSLDNGEPLEIGHLFAGFSTHAVPLLLLGLLMLLAITIISFTAGITAAAMFGASAAGAASSDGNQMLNLMAQHGMLFVAVLLLIQMVLFLPVSMAYWFAPALVVFHGLGPVAALKQSFQGCLRNVWPFLLYGILLTGLLIIGMIPLLLGLLVVIPTMYASVYASYKDIYLR